MREGKERADWSRTASLMALTVNLNRDPRKGRAATPADFDPFTPRQAASAEGGFAAFKAAFCGGRAPQEIDDGRKT